MQKNNWTNYIFKPSINLMSRLGYLNKFAIIAVLFLTLVVTISYFLFDEINNSINFTNKERMGLEAIKMISPIIQNIQKHRGQASAYLNGDQSFADIMRENEKNIEKDMSLMDVTQSKYEKELLFGGQWKVIKGKWANLKDVNQSLTSESSFYQHTDLLREIFLVNKRIGNTSNLILDPKSETYHLINFVINLLPELAEYLGQTRAFGLTLKPDINLTKDEKRVINGLVSSSRLAISQIDENREFILAGMGEKEGQIVKASILANKSTIDDLMNYLDSNLMEKGKMVSSYPEYYSKLTKQIDSLFSLSNSLLPTTDQLLKARINEAEMKRNLVLVLGFGIMFVILYIFIGFYFSVKNTINELGEISDRLKRGEGGEKIKLSAKDELGKIGDLFASVGDALVSSNKILEEDIAKRKEAEEKLKARTNEMERINDFMIGRELKMVELKAEVKEMRAKMEKMD